MVKVIAYRVGREPVVEEIDLGVSAIQKFVGGTFAGHFFGRGGVMIYCNDDGKSNGSAPNRYCTFLQDILMGDFMVTRHNVKGYEADVTDGDLVYCKDVFTPAVAVRG